MILLYLGVTCMYSGENVVCRVTLSLYLHRGS